MPRVSRFKPCDPQRLPLSLCVDDVNVSQVPLRLRAEMTCRLDLTPSAIAISLALEDRVGEMKVAEGVPL